MLIELAEIVTWLSALHVCGATYCCRALLVPGIIETSSGDHLRRVRLQGAPGTASVVKRTDLTQKYSWRKPSEIGPCTRKTPSLSRMLEPHRTGRRDM
ncbi:Hypothetical protein NTJ_01576 [Nesidiocoris tenuis]|uniref:Secreted protein n=1 Tax=Nesidiocoris tenuis TaxID=355587 RepID=A0ABN7A8Y3_9HEMI|nr:Hypothetical protein NTJ_01576 [Nesidiocoris tenuis]